MKLTGLPVAEFTESQFGRLFDINTRGAYFTMQSATARVVDKGRIIYIGSSTTGYPGRAMPSMAAARRRATFPPL
ncbi:hypothetical protein NU688_26920 [Variovorax sp. ZS18.2.2]|uniref:hypothetical protein n=1 Tax=Variovorax sp. ZS18.2.2 TaxID=2971255 RepID=UPI002151C5D7|nr:hypothetical protein [Variovorax sp. ZS18.2.2]MCR6479817.1 hypothetical protein [Variovorax sp. ZS18.2.2]